MTATGQADTSPDLAMRPFTASLPMALLDARENAMRVFRPLLAAHDLTEQQWRVLRALAAASDPLEVSELAEATSLLAPSLTRILANLDARSLIDRRPADHDQRRSLVSLSDGGIDLARTVAPSSEDAYRGIEQAFGTDRLHRLLDELHALAALDLDPVERADARPNVVDPIDQSGKSDKSDKSDQSGGGRA